ncbi:hypothetical protein CALVIDRAFT_528849 [Calocera viscosa TUFC12733]|uniref:Uncharacterized protein n=1 Tax=Calocera viscosa (strain TUFC12733) TaxID=1330018 RepID=A0A167K7W1_CALVF|nr:hypothetical protein CALVIDRAFT_528849 [Calocera viscosa TUFC12733]
MRPRIRPPSFVPRLLPHRQYASGSSGEQPAYHPKVCALPFTVSPEDAKLAFKTNVLKNYQDLPDPMDMMDSLTEKILTDKMGAKKGGGSWRPLLGLKIADLAQMAADMVWKEEKFSAMYLPTWLVNSCVSLNYTLRERGEVEHKVFGVLDATIPGHGYPPLANLWLSEPWGSNAQPRPFTPSMLKTQWGDEVGTIKYTVSPLKMLEMWKDLPPTAREFGDQGITILPDAHMSGMSLLPLLRPVYISVFVLPYKSQRVTLVLPASLSSEAYHLNYIYQPRDKAALSRKAVYYSQHTDANAGFGLTINLMHNVAKSSSLWNTMGPKLIDVMKDARQNRVDWGEIGGVDDKMWEDDRIVSYELNDWTNRKMEVGRLQQQETLKTIFREERTDLSEEEVERKAQTLSRFIDKLRAENGPTDNLDLEEVEKAAAQMEENERTAGKQ